jgi:hypothetical protein
LPPKERDSRRFRSRLDHDPQKDVIRVNLRQEELAEGVERFTIAVVPLGKAGEIHFDWDRTRWVLPFTLK